jgi:hypothetical protein
MKPFLLGLSSLAFSAGFAHAAITLTAVGVYDPAGPNDVDTSAGGSSVSTYATLFSDAFNSNSGGVLNFENRDPSTNPLTDTTLSVIYGATGINSMTISRPSSGRYQFDNAPTTVGTPISGNMYLRSETENFFVFNFSSGLTAVGFTVLSRNSTRTIQATVTYLEGGTDVISGELINTSGDDTFYGFTAPVDKTIGSLLIQATATGASDDNRFFAIDDLGFVVANPIPEPSVVGLGGIGLLAMLRRRR